MSKFTREAWIEKRVAEGFTAEQAGNEYDNYLDPAIKEAQEQKVPTRGDMIQMINEARLNNPNRKKVYTPDFRFSKEYLKLKEEVKALMGVSPYDTRKAQELSKQMLSIQLGGTITEEERQAAVDETLTMPIADILKERKKYEKLILEYEEKIDNFDVSPVKAKIDAVEKQYKREAKNNAGKWVVLESIEEEYNKAVEEIEHKYITIPLNDLAIKRYEAKEYFLIYEARLKYYIAANKGLIEEEILNAKRMEVRGSLVDLVAYLEEENPLGNRVEFMEG